jgi:hypothetical protein
MSSIKWASSHYPHKWRTFYTTPGVMAHRYSPVWDLRKVLGSPNGVQVKLKLALCQWAWVGACQQLVRLGLIWWIKWKTFKKKKKLVQSSHDETMKMVCKWNSCWPYANELDFGGAKQLARLGLLLCFKRKKTKNCTLFKWRDYKRMWFNDQEKPSRFLNKR